MYPSPVVYTGLTIGAGDSISASVSYTGSNQYTLSLTDVTTGANFSTIQSGSAQRSSAEWVEEAPSSSRGVLPLANFGTVNFSGATATINGTQGPADNSWSGSTLYQIDMVTPNRSLKATTSALSNSDNFSVTFVSSGVSGSGGKGGGHGGNNASEILAADPSQSANFESAVQGGLLAAPSQTSTTLVSAQLPTSIMVASPVGSLPNQTTPPYLTPNFVYVGSGSTAEEGPKRDTPPPNGTMSPEDSAPAPDAPRPPRNMAPEDPAPAPRQEESLQIAPSPASSSGASVELERGSAAAGATGKWRNIALAGVLVLALAVDRAWVTGIKENKETKRRQDGQDPSLS
jgi:hypothetical protein